MYHKIYNQSIETSQSSNSPYPIMFIDTMCWPEGESHTTTLPTLNDPSSLNVPISTYSERSPQFEVERYPPF